jgi:diguanylate cyclase (GGDEF)-like protein
MDGEKVGMTASFGMATFPEDGTSSADLLVKVDERLYRAKWEGKNRVVYE